MILLFSIICLFMIIILFFNVLSINGKIVAIYKSKYPLQLNNLSKGEFIENRRIDILILLDDGINDQDLVKLRNRAKINTLLILLFLIIFIITINII